MTELIKDNLAEQRRPLLIQNWISAIGLIIAAASFFAAVCLLAIDFFAHFANPYMGVLTYFVAPFFLIMGLALVLTGIALERRRLVHRAAGKLGLFPIIDLNRPQHRKIMGALLGFGAAFFLATAIGSYRSYHFTESVQFCGRTCHAVMKPEFVAYQNSPHARVTCTQCHIGPGADWFVRSKMSGAYQVYATLADKFPRPVPTPIKNLRPAQETCEQCHWPRKFFGNAERVNHHFMADKENTPWTIRLLMKIGGGDPEYGPVGGIHWHMNIANKVEYIAADAEREIIPWVRVTHADGRVDVYQSKDNPLTTEQIAAAKPRTMDCIDCHNRPAHNYQPPARAVNIALSTGRIDTNLPYIKKNAVEVLTAKYDSSDEAAEKIQATLAGNYRDHPDQGKVRQAIAEVKKIYSQSFFPEMKANWRIYPNHIGHTIFPGCYRCHDGKHTTKEGKIISHDCNACHAILAQGRGSQLEAVSSKGFDFEHPTDIAEMWKEMNCADCHTGALTQ